MIVICPIDVADHSGACLGVPARALCRPTTAKFAQLAVRELLSLLDHSLTHIDA
jgi:hypothetical protein